MRESVYKHLPVSNFSLKLSFQNSITHSEPLKTFNPGPIYAFSITEWKGVFFPWAVSAVDGGIYQQKHCPAHQENSFFVILLCHPSFKQLRVAYVIFWGSPFNFTTSLRGRLIGETRTCPQSSLVQWGPMFQPQHHSDSNSSMSGRHLV